jgi:hypothetical protein
MGWANRALLAGCRARGYHEHNLAPVMEGRSKDEAYEFVRLPQNRGRFSWTNIYFRLRGKPGLPECIQIDRAMRNVCIY